MEFYSWFGTFGSDLWNAPFDAQHKASTDAAGAEVETDLRAARDGVCNAVSVDKILAPSAHDMGCMEWTS